MSDSDSNNGLPINIAAFLLLCLSAAGVLIEPLISSRPDEPWIKDSKQEKNEELIETRLWQDPFMAQKLSRQQPTEGNSANNNKEPDTFQDELKEFYRYRNLSVMAVSLSGSPYPEIAETRRRHRFAVVSAFHSKDYYPGNSERIGYLNLKGCETNTYDIPYEWFDKDEEKLPSVLVLWINESEIKGNYRRFIDCLAKVINEEWKKSWLSKEKEPPEANRLEFKLIGPSATAPLVELLKEAPFDYSEITTFAHSATTPNNEIIKLLRADCLREEKSNWKESSEKWYCEPVTGFENKLREGMFNEKFHDQLSKRKIIRTIGTDDNLATALLWELSNRGINKFDDNLASQCKDGLVLIAELDTFYARSLVSNLKQNTLWENCGDDSPVRSYAYLRGVDGKMPYIYDKDKEKESTGNNKNTPMQWDDAPPEHAEGRNQYDYLRRLADTIEELDRNPRFAENGVKAVGILGSDVYDKLLILHALREKFNDKIFFTTDLDARYWHADQIKWTRNLIVASNFDLKLHSKWQGESMPFRDSYQSSMYYSVLRALGCNSCNQEQKEDWDKQVSKPIKPQLFEIGRTKAISLNSPSVDNLKEWQRTKETVLAENKCSFSDNPKDCMPTLSERSLQRNTKWEILENTGSMIVAGVMIFVFYSIVIGKSIGNRHVLNSLKEITKRKTMLGIMVTICFVWLAGQFVREDIYEPFIWSEGVSVWPNLIVRFAGIALILGFFWYFYQQFRIQREKEIQSYFLEFNNIRKP